MISFHKYLIGVLVLFDVTIQFGATDDATQICPSDTSCRWTSDDIEDTGNSVFFTVSKGYFVAVTVSDIVMTNTTDDSVGNYLLIQGGTSRNDTALDGHLFANQVAEPHSYIFQGTSVYAFCENSKGQNFTFKLMFETAGETTTTEIITTTTQISVPTTQKGDSIYATVNVTGRYLKDYKRESTITLFKDCIVKMATNFVEELKVDLTQPITTKYVMISLIDHCPYNWPSSTKCVRITFKIPIFHNGTIWDGYEMNSDHLLAMWARWAELDDQCLKDNSFFIYNEPDIENAITWWAIGVCVVIVLFTSLLCFLRTVSKKMRTAFQRRKRRASDSDTTSIISRKTNSIASLTPHYLQDHLDTPKFFET